MTDIPKHLEDAWSALQRGDWDSVSSDEMDALSDVLDRDAQLAATLDHRIAESDVDLPDVPLPSWDGAWDKIATGLDQEQQAATENAEEESTVYRLRWYGLGSAGIAAALMLSFIWQPFGNSTNGSLRLATSDDTIIESVEVYDGMSFLVSAGSDGDVPIIWVVEEDSEQP